MNEIIILLIVSLFTGISVKLVDLIEDDGYKLFKFDSIIFSIIYGILIGNVIVNYPIVAPLWIATILAMFFAEKIDRLSHVAGVIITALYVIIFKIQKINLVLLVVFFFAAYLDERVNDFIGLNKKKVKNKMFRKILEVRPLLEITALIASIILGNYSLFFALLCFDIGYQVTEMMIAKNKHF